MQGLVVQIAIHITLSFPVVHDAFIAPGGPVMGGEWHFHPVTVTFDSRIHRLTPQQSVTHFRTTQRLQIMHVVRHIFCRTEGFQLRKPNHDFYGSFRVKYIDKLHLHAVNGVFLSGVCYFNGRAGDTFATRWHTLSQTTTQCTFFTRLQLQTIHISGTAGHSHSGQHVFVLCRGHEAFGSDDVEILFRWSLLHRSDTSVMVAMRVGENYALYR